MYHENVIERNLSCVDRHANTAAIDKRLVCPRLIAESVGTQISQIGFGTAYDANLCAIIAGYINLALNKCITYS